MLGDLSPNGEFEGVKAVGVAAGFGRGGLREALEALASERTVCLEADAALSVAI